MYSVRLKKGKDKAVHQLHPWIFSGAVDHVSGKPADGDLVTVTDHGNDFLAYGFYNSKSRVAVRVLEWDPQIVVDEAWWRTRIQQAVNARQHLFERTETNTCRLIFSEADYLPGLIVDRFADYLSVQILTSGIEKIKDIVIDELRVLLQPKGIFDRSDISARAHEGMGESGGVAWGDKPPEFVEVSENGIKYLVNISEGQKSGFYCDQQ
jgi:23S rRNA (cytosine1962-C5)-methyltransferase